MTEEECDHTWIFIKDVDGSGRDCSYYECTQCGDSAYPEDMTSTNEENI